MLGFCWGLNWCFVISDTCNMSTSCRWSAFINSTWTAEHWGGGRFPLVVYCKCRQQEAFIMTSVLEIYSSKWKLNRLHLHRFFFSNLLISSLLAAKQGADLTFPYVDQTTHHQSLVDHFLNHFKNKVSVLWFRAEDTTKQIESSPKKYNLN